MTPKAILLSVVPSALIAVVVSRLLFRDNPGLEVASITVLTLVFMLLSAVVAGIVGKNSRR
jgi:H+/Cl- antiporter ClcA